MRYIVEYTTLTGRRIPVAHKVFEDAASARAFGREGVKQGNYKDYTVVNVADRTNIGESKSDKKMTAAHKKLARDVHKQLNRDEPMAQAAGMKLKANHKMLKSEYGKDWRKLAGINEEAEIELEKGYTIHTDRPQDFVGTKTAGGDYVGGAAGEDRYIVDQAMKKIEYNDPTDSNINQIIDRVCDELNCSPRQKRMIAKIWQKIGYDVRIDEVSTGKLRDYASAALQDKNPEKAGKRWKYASKAMDTVADREVKAAHARKYNKMESVELDEAETKYVIKHKKTKQVLNTHDDYETAKDELNGLGADKADYGVYKQTKKDAALRNRNTYREAVDLNEGTTEADWKKDSAAVKKSKDPKFISKMIDKWGQRGGAWLNHPALKEAVELDEGTTESVNETEFKSGKDVDNWVNNEFDGDYQAALDHALEMANIGRDRTWLPVIKYLDKKEKTVNEISDELKKRYHEKGREDVYNRFTGRGKYEKPRDPAHYTPTGRVKKGVRDRPEAVKYREKIASRNKYLAKVKDQLTDESVITEGDIVNFSSYAGMYSDGAHASFFGRDGNMHTISATGDRPRKYYIDGKEVSWEDAKRIVGNQKLQPRQGMAKSVNEGLSDDAHYMERDHEVQMARSDLYKTANYAVKLHSILKGISEEQGLEGWMQAKITKAADYLGSVFHALEYDQMERGQGNLTMPVGEAKVNEGIENLSNAKLKYHAVKGVPHGRYSSKEIKDEHNRRKKSEPNYHTVKPSMNETTTAGAIATAPMPMESVTESREMTKAAVMKKIKAGEWEAIQDLKPGKHCEVRNTATGKKMQIMIKETTSAGGVAAVAQPLGKTVKRKATK